MKNEEHPVDIAYGKGRIPLRLDPDLAEWCVITPTYEQALINPHEDFLQACRYPISAPPLRALVEPGDRVVIVTSDGTRPVPNRQLIPWLLEELPVPVENVTVLLGNGTHRANSPEEIAQMFGHEVTSRVAILNHDAYDADRNQCVGTTPTGIGAFLDKCYLEADKRIVIGFIEPHFFAGFSGGAKGIFPGVAGIDTILRLHDYDLIADPRSTWGELENNPIQREIADMAAYCPPDFLVNVTLNSDKQIAGFFAGQYQEAHRRGCARAKAVSMAPLPNRFPIVVTSNSGFPLDQNLYQTVKGMSVAARIVEDGGTILVASECSDGIPEHGNFRSILEKGDTPEAVDDWIRNLSEPILDQWEAQVLVSILMRASVAIYSTLDRTAIEDAMLTPIEDLQAHLEECIRRVGEGASVAVLPDGPLTIPYVAD
jgi:nickel-dependent lactate racemase